MNIDDSLLCSFQILPGLRNKKWEKFKRTEKIKSSKLIAEYNFLYFLIL